MRLYILAILLAFTLTATAPPAASAADVSGQFGQGSLPPKETSANKYVPPANNDRPGGGGGHGRPPGHGFDKPGRPGDDNRPGGGGRPGRHDYGFDKPGRPGKHHSGRPSGNRNYGWGLNCYPYCKGVGLWYGGSDDDDDYDYYQSEPQYVQPQEPERSFQSGGTFEWFDDPRGQPAHDSGYPRYSGDQQAPAQFDIDQYHMMMKAWQ